MKEYGFNTTLLHGQRRQILLARHRFRSTSPVHSVTIQQRNSKRFLQINGPDIHIQESTIRQLKLLRNE